ncbi:MAG: conjugal transfer protein TraO [Phocaeicola sp.]
MKKILFAVITLLVLFIGQVHTQRYLPKMRGIELKGGFVDGVQSPLNYYGGIALSTYTKRADRWVFGVEYLHKGYSYKNITIPKS